MKAALFLGVLCKGTPEVMLRIQAHGKPDEWYKDNIEWYMICSEKKT
ncbi:MAG: hypothetical protein RR365_10750 [Bacteroides sp.]